MKLFSERLGIRPGKTVFQINSMDDDLRTGLWNVLVSVFWRSYDYAHETYDNCRLEQLMEELWRHHLRRNLDDLSYDWSRSLKMIKDSFFKCDWDEVYSLMEFIGNNYDYDYNVSVEKESVLFRYHGFIKQCNDVLKREMSGYRLAVVAGKAQFIPLISEQEVSEIQEAAEFKPFLNPVSKHLRRAIELFSDRKSPDYRNSVKESISAVEAMCNIISGKNNKGLGAALGEIQKTKKVEVHKALKAGFEKIYGWTSDANGIRHPMMEMSTVDFEDAKFMLVACSAFVNYLKEKAINAGLRIE